jgi:hypothetical protein
MKGYKMNKIQHIEEIVKKPDEVTLNLISARMDEVINTLTAVADRVRTLDMVLNGEDIEEFDNHFPKSIPENIGKLESINYRISLVFDTYYIIDKHLANVTNVIE